MSCCILTTCDISSSWPFCESTPKNRVSLDSSQGQRRPTFFKTAGPRPIAHDDTRARSAILGVKRRRLIGATIRMRAHERTGRLLHQWDILWRHAQGVYMRVSNRTGEVPVTTHKWVKKNKIIRLKQIPSLPLSCIVPPYLTFYADTPFLMRHIGFVIPFHSSTLPRSHYAPANAIIEAEACTRCNFLDVM